MYELWCVVSIQIVINVLTTVLLVVMAIKLKTLYKKNFELEYDVKITLADALGRLRTDVEDLADDVEELGHDVNG
jgi:hypothetical protein